MNKTKLKLYFKDSANAAKSISVDYPKDNYQTEDLSAAMDKIIASQVLTTKNGTISTKEKAQLENTTIVDLGI